jgi:hypothetical protein
MGKRSAAGALKIVEPGQLTGELALLFGQTTFNL